MLLDQQTVVNNIEVAIEKKTALKKNLQQKVLTQWGRKFYDAVTGRSKDKNIVALINGNARLVKITIPQVRVEERFQTKLYFHLSMAVMKSTVYMLTKPQQLSQVFLARPTTILFSPQKLELDQS